MSDSRPSSSPVGIAVFSRLDSSRLPGKALRMIAGRTLMGRVADRVRRVPAARVVIATSDRAVDDPIAAAAAEEGLDVFRGDTHDLAFRAFACAEHFGFERLVRISGDSPFIPPELISDMLAHPQSDGETLVTNVFPRSYPPGASVEVLGRKFLEQLLAEPLSPEDREHVTRYAYAHPTEFRIVNVGTANPDYSGVTLTVDTAQDMARMERIATALGPDSAEAGLDGVVAAARACMSSNGR